MKVSKIFVRSLATTRIIFSGANSSKTFNKDIIIRNIDASQKSPLMVIVGWSNSNNKQVAKYSQLYENMGFTTISISCKLYRFSMFYDTLFADDTKACLNAMTSQRDVNKDRKVFFQLFSTPGPAMYINIINYYYRYIDQHFGTDRYQNDDVDDIPRISGVVFDSPTIESGNAEQFANGMKGDANINFILDKIYDQLGKVIHWYAVRNSKMHNYGPEFIRNMPVSIPQLILFSKSDKIASYDAILRYINQQKSIGAEVYHNMWDSSPHVLHYRKYPDQYTSLVNRFLENCLASEAKKDVKVAKEDSPSFIVENDVVSDACEKRV